MCSFDGVSEGEMKDVCGRINLAALFHTGLYSPVKNVPKEPQNMGKENETSAGPLERCQPRFVPLKWACEHVKIEWCATIGTHELQPKFGGLRYKCPAQQSKAM